MSALEYGVMHIHVHCTGTSFFPIFILIFSSYLLPSSKLLQWHADQPSTTLQAASPRLFHASIDKVLVAWSIDIKNVFHLHPTSFIDRRGMPETICAGTVVTPQ